MITSRCPVWRSNPAGFSVSGYWPIPTGTLAVLIISPILGFVVLLMSDTLFAASEFNSPYDSSNQYVASIGLILIGSPMVSWAALIVAIPISGYLARMGYAGWGVAALAGGVIGFIIGWVVAGEFTPQSDVKLFTGCGILLALIYWGAVRVVHPTFFGVAFTAKST